MNALIALLHFCEVHGPCVVFCTQAIHRMPDQQQQQDMNSTLAACTLNDNSATLHAAHDKPHPHKGVPPQPASPEPRVSPPSLSARKPPTSVTQPFASSLSPPKSTSCPACSAQIPSVIGKDGTIHEVKMLVTDDDTDPSVQYVGSKAPQQLHLYKAVRLACVRSLTTEFCPGRDGPVLFGDDENGYVMSYMLKLRDSQARGEVRFYSLMMLMTDRVYLTSCWPFLVSAFRSMAVNLQDRADAVFQREKESRSIHNTPMVNNRRMAVMSQADQFFRRRSNTALRSLVDLLGIKDIYAQIHAQFSYILKLSARRRMEKITPGRGASDLYIKAREEYRTRQRQQQHQTEQEKERSIEGPPLKEQVVEPAFAKPAPLHHYPQQA